MAITGKTFDSSRKTKALSAELFDYLLVKFTIWEKQHLSVFTGNVNYQEI